MKRPHADWHPVTQLEQAGVIKRVMAAIRRATGDVMTRQRCRAQVLAGFDTLVRLLDAAKVLGIEAETADVLVMDVDACIFTACRLALTASCDGEGRPMSFGCGEDVAGECCRMIWRIAKSEGMPSRCKANALVGRRFPALCCIMEAMNWAVMLLCTQFRTSRSVADWGIRSLIEMMRTHFLMRVAFVEGVMPNACAKVPPNMLITLLVHTLAQHHEAPRITEAATICLLMLGAGLRREGVNAVEMLCEEASATQTLAHVALAPYLDHAATGAADGEPLWRQSLPPGALTVGAQNSRVLLYMMCCHEPARGRDAIDLGCPEVWFGDEQPELAGLLANMPEPGP
jgi:hypothetical protein